MKASQILDLNPFRHSTNPCQKTKCSFFQSRLEYNHLAVGIETHGVGPWEWTNGGLD